MALDLTYASIDSFSEALDAFQQGFGMDRTSRLRTRLLLEEILLNLREHYGEYQRFEAFFETRRIRRPRVRIEVKGEAFNPLGTTEEEQDDWSRSIFSSGELHPQYVFSVDTNELHLTLPTPSMNPVLRIGLSIALGIIFGLIGSLIMPEHARSVVSGTFITPVYNMWLRLLGAISAPIIFFTAATTMLNTKRITDQGASSITLILRYFLLSGLIVVGAILSCVVFFPLVAGFIHINANLIATLLNEATSIVPSDMVTAFSSSNTPQLLLAAFVFGTMLVRLGTQTSELQQLVRQVNLLGLVAAEWMSHLVPYFVGMFICLEIWYQRYGLLAIIWQPLIAAVTVSVVVTLLYLLFVATRMRISPLMLLRKLAGQFWKVLRRGQFDYTFDALASDCEQLFGIREDYAKAAMPQGLNLFMPISAVGIYIFAVFVAREQQLQVDNIWIVRAAVMAIVLFVATPPVAGANLLAYVAFFAYLGISDDTLMDAMIFDIIFGVFANASNLVLLQLETILQASHVGFLDEGKLRN